MKASGSKRLSVADFRQMVRVSSNAAKTAFALHAIADGSFLSSISFRLDAMRITVGKRRLTYPRAAVTGFNYLSNGWKFRIIDSTNNGQGMQVFDQLGNEVVLLHASDRSLIIHNKKGNVATYKVTTHIDDPGIWHGDDDFRTPSAALASISRAAMDVGASPDSQATSGPNVCGILDLEALLNAGTWTAVSSFSQPTIEDLTNWMIEANATYAGIAAQTSIDRSDFNDMMNANTSAAGSLLDLVGGSFLAAYYYDLAQVAAAQFSQAYCGDSACP